MSTVHQLPEMIHYDEAKIQHLLKQDLLDNNVNISGEQAEQYLETICERLEKTDIEEHTRNSIMEQISDMLVVGSEYAYMLGVKSGAGIINALL